MRSHTPLRAQTHEPRMRALVLAVTLRQVTPARSRAQHPQNSVHKLPVVRCRTPHMLRTSRKNVLDPQPLCFAQLVSTRHPATATSPNKKSEVHMWIRPRTTAVEIFRTRRVRPPKGEAIYGFSSNTVVMGLTTSCAASPLDEYASQGTANCLGEGSSEMASTLGVSRSR
jgi:hypothetical protein